MRSLEELAEALQWYASYMRQHQLYETEKGLHAIADELKQHTVSEVPGKPDPDLGE